MCLQHVDVSSSDTRIYLGSLAPTVYQLYQGGTLKSLFHKRERGSEVLLRVPQDVLPLLRDYAEKKNMSLEDALHDLIVKGYRYQQLETMYGKHVSDREVRDKRFYFLKIEAGYLYYRK